MPYYEFFCCACQVFFDVGTEKEIELKSIVCVNCMEIYSDDRKFPGVRLNNYNKTLGLRLENLSNSIMLLQDRFDAFEDAVLQGDISVGFDDVEPTDESSN